MKYNWSKIWWSYVALLYQFIMDLNTQEIASLPNSSILEVDKDGSQLAWDLEVVRPIPPTSEMLHSTGDSIITPSNVDITVATENKSDANAIYYSETEEIPKVLLDHELSKECYGKKISCNALELGYMKYLTSDWFC